nr:MAG TPA: hypothetical protein [Caudoviricetes sp.]
MVNNYQEILNKDIEYIVVKVLLVQLHLMAVGSVHALDYTWCD